MKLLGKGLKMSHESKEIWSLQAFAMSVQIKAHHLIPTSMSETPTIWLDNHQNHNNQFNDYLFNLIHSI